MPGRRGRPNGRAIVMIGVIALGALIGTPRLQPTRAGGEALPDLAMAPLSDFQIQWVNGRRLLRFTAMMVNVGSGNFEVRGSRASTGQPMVMRQRIFTDTSHTNVSRDVVTNAVAKYAGDGHSHWHVQEMMRYDMWGPVGTHRGAKVGFCFLDSDVYNSSLPGYDGGFYNGSMCSTNPSALSNRMGISIGLGDEYEWYLAWQWVDITGMPSGTYTLRAKVDPYGFFIEEDETNQCGYAVLRFTTSSNAVTMSERAAGCVNDWTGLTHEEHIEWMLATGISFGCGPELFCTGNPVTRGQMAAFLSRALDLPAAGEDYFDDDAGSTFEVSINRLAASGITAGCAERRYCPDRMVSRGQMAAFLTRAFSLPSATQDYYTDDNGTQFEDSINRVTEAEIAFGCTPTTYCPQASVTRGQMAAFLHRAIE